MISYLTSSFGSPRLNAACNLDISEAADKLFCLSSCSMAVFKVAHGATSFLSRASSNFRSVSIRSPGALTVIFDVNSLRKVRGQREYRKEPQEVECHCDDSSA
ncbi:hypothetical protein MRX96_020595 [Rhipicephalus microplus]